MCVQWQTVTNVLLTQVVRFAMLPISSSKLISNMFSLVLGHELI